MDSDDSIPTSNSKSNSNSNADTGAGSRPAANVTGTKRTRRSLLGAVAAGVVALGAELDIAAAGDASASRPAGPAGRIQDELADDSDDSDDAYVDLYESIIDDVVLVTLSGVEGPGAGGLGSGFVVDDRVVTNAHVVQDTDEVELQFTDEQWRTASVLGTDEHSDLAVLEIDDIPDVVDGLSLSDEEPRIGQEVVALGNPLGLDASITQGIVSGVDRSLPSPTGFSIPAAIQTDAPVNPGNSGGPLVDLDGNVLGVVFAGAGQTIGFAISAQLADRVVPALAEDGEYRHPYVGIGVDPVDPRIAEANDLEEARGVLVRQVADGGPADGVFEPAGDVVTVDGAFVPAGGDVIVAIDDEEIPNEERLASYLALETSPDETVDVEVFRAGERETVALTLEERPAVDGP
ncbi:S1C family serine protease [Halobiforma nitratireducens]|uniref:Peptidase S1 and S6 chymotrypsin/Hap n=1 Tax=Halobiforma nitratireducens JCM 10879 TaxID=1227454 RepID=M0MB20_9EURY|nr:trypsin-like peptidase domain-containing protein [Halobiforma nitratireducens]EMA42951.1 peptidase S1 and S6 chymotrypsin/Hap [Halobiforma nitratireducens JCM 10879]